MAEPVYDSDDSGIISRVVSLAIAGYLIWYYLNLGSLRGGRIAFTPLIPLLMIWFPDKTSEYLGDGVTRPLVVRVAWVALCALTALPILTWLT